jgi:hypothetical protein
VRKRGGDAAERALRLVKQAELPQHDSAIVVDPLTRQAVGLELWGTARGEHVALVRELGATPIDYQHEDFTCRNWYSISRTASDNGAHHGTRMIARSAPSPSSPAPSARRYAALGPDCSARPSKPVDHAVYAHR